MREKETKEGKVLAILYLVLSILLIVGPRSIFPVCPVGHSPMKCYWSTQALIPLAVILFTIGILFFVARIIQVKMVLSIIAIVTAAMVILIPAKLIGGCQMKTMACQSLTFPAVYLIGTALILSSIGELIFLKKKAESNKWEREDESR